MQVFDVDNNEQYLHIDSKLVFNENKCDNLILAVIYF